MIDIDNFEKLSKIADQWDKAERLIKRAETLCDGVCIPAIFELRYAGRRLIDALRVASGQSLDTDETRDQQFIAFIHETKQCCLRAHHDAVDAVIMHIRQNINLMIKEFGEESISESISEYNELVNKIRQISELVAESRGDRQRRLPTYNNIDEAEITRLINLFQRIEKAEEALILAKRRSVRNKMAAQLAFWIGILGSIASIVSLMGW